MYQHHLQVVVTPEAPLILRPHILVVAGVVQEQQVQLVVQMVVQEEQDFIFL
jgi:hypothetical protein